MHTAVNKDEHGIKAKFFVESLVLTDVSYETVDNSDFFYCVLTKG